MQKVTLAEASENLDWMRFSATTNLFINYNI